VVLLGLIIRKIVGAWVFQKFAKELEPHNERD